LKRINFEESKTHLVTSYVPYALPSNILFPENQYSASETSCTVVSDEQEMDAGNFKGLILYQWHIGVVGSNDLTKIYLYCCYAVTMPGSLTSNLMPCSVAEDGFRFFRPATLLETFNLIGNTQRSISDCTLNPQFS